MRRFRKQAFAWISIVAVFLIGAIYLPNLIEKWRQYQESIEVSHVAMVYKPYSDRQMDSVGEELNAMAVWQEQGIEVNRLQLVTGYLPMSKEKIKTIIDGELDLWHTKEVLPEPIHIFKIGDITYHQLIPENVNLYDMDEQEKDSRSTDDEQGMRITYWNVECDLEEGNVTLQMDRAMKKILGLHMRGININEDAFEQWKIKLNQKSTESREWMNEVWSDIYGYTLNKTENSLSYNGSVENIWEENGSFSTSYEIAVPSGRYLDVFVDVVNYQEDDSNSYTFDTGVGIFANY